MGKSPICKGGRPLFQVEGLPLILITEAPGVCSASRAVVRVVREQRIGDEDEARRRGRILGCVGDGIAPCLRRIIRPA